MNIISQLSFGLAATIFAFLIAALSDSTLIARNPIASALVVMMLPLNIAIGIAYQHFPPKNKRPIKTMLSRSFSMVFTTTSICVSRILDSLSPSVGLTFLIGMCLAYLMIDRVSSDIKE